MSKIYDNLFLGNITTSRDEAFFKKNCIKNVLIAAKNLQRSFPKICKYCQLQISDNPTTIILKYWPESIEFLSQAAGNTLVHCQGGKSRSASTVMAFVMFKENISAEEAVVKVRKCHKFAYPNAGFLKQLEYWQSIVEEYRKVIPINNQKEDYKLLEQITSNKLSEVSSSIIKPDQDELSIASQKLNFIEILDGTNPKKKTGKFVKKSVDKELLQENKQIKNQMKDKNDDEEDDDNNDNLDADDAYDNNQNEEILDNIEFNNKEINNDKDISIKKPLKIYNDDNDEEEQKQNSQN